MKRLTDRLPIVVIAVMGMAYVIMSLMMPLLGDDMGYAHNYFTNYQGVADLPLIMGRHWYHVNSRMADMLNSVWFGMIPRWMLALMCGLMVVGYFQLTARCAHIKSASGRTILATLLVFTMPWWDSFFLFVCQFNYVWSSVMVLFILGFVTARINLIGWWQWVAVPVALIAGWMHEAAGLPAAFGLMVWMVTCHKLVSLSPARGWSIVTFCIGAAMSATSPASWNRVTHVEPNDPMWLLLLKSDFYALALVVIIIYLIAYRRTTLINAIRSPWTVFASAALASMCISAIGGIVGRSGWFAQTFALIALFWPGMPLRTSLNPSPLIGRLLTAVLSLLIIVHMAEVVRWQLRADTEIEQSINLYRKSTDGTIYFDPIQRYAFPWWCLNKNKGVPDADDYYINETFDRCIGGNRKQLRVLPTDAQMLHGTEITHPRPLGAGMVSREMPQADSSTHTVTPFISVDSIILYYTAPRIIDPGDR